MPAVLGLSTYDSVGQLNVPSVIAWSNGDTSSLADTLIFTGTGGTFSAGTGGTFTGGSTSGTVTATSVGAGYVNFTPTVAALTTLMVNGTNSAELFSGASLTLQGHAPITYYVRTTGNDTNTGLDAAHAFATPLPACVGGAHVAMNGDIIDVGGGAFNLGANQIVKPNGVNLHGAGSASTTITIAGVSSSASVEAGLYLITGNASDSGFTLLFTDTTGKYQWIGALNCTDASTITLSDLYISGDGDCVNSGPPGTPNGTLNLTMVRCECHTHWDGLNFMVKGVANVLDSQFIGTGRNIVADDLGDTSHGAAVSGVANFTGCTFIAIDGKVETAGVLGSAGTATLNGCTIITNGTSPLLADVYSMYGTHVHLIDSRYNPAKLVFQAGGYDNHITQTNWFGYPVLAGVSAVRSGADVVVTWTAFAYATSYRVSRDGGAYAAKTSGYTDTGAATGWPHTYTVQALDAGGNIMGQGIIGTTPWKDTGLNLQLNLV